MPSSSHPSRVGCPYHPAAITDIFCLSSRGVALGALVYYFFPAPGASGKVALDPRLTATFLSYQFQSADYIEFRYNNGIGLKHFGARLPSTPS